MNNLINTLGRRVFETMGLEVRWARNVQRNRQQESWDQQKSIWAFLQRYTPATLFDIGANDGLFARLCRELLPNTHLVCFEPLADHLQVLRETIKSIGNAELIASALGETAGTVTMNLNDFSPSSSLLPIGELHTSEMPYTAATRPVEVAINRLDDCLAGRQDPHPWVIKMDVQGFEDRVIRGGSNTISQAVAVVVECGSYPLYESQATFDDIHALMQGMGFVFRGVIDQMHAKDGRILQFDALYEKQ